MSTLKEIGKTFLPVGIGVTPTKIVEYSITAQVGLLPLILIWAIVMESLHAFGVMTGPWDMGGAFRAIEDYEVAACGLIATGSAHAYFKKPNETAEPDVQDQQPAQTAQNG